MAARLQAQMWRWPVPLAGGAQQRSNGFCQHLCLRCSLFSPGGSCPAALALEQKTLCVPGALGDAIPLQELLGECLWVSESVLRPFERTPESSNPPSLCLSGTKSPDVIGTSLPGSVWGWDTSLLPWDLCSQDIAPDWEVLHVGERPACPESPLLCQTGHGSFCTSLATGLCSARLQVVCRLAVVLMCSWEEMRLPPPRF